MRSGASRRHAIGVAVVDFRQEGVQNLLNAAQWRPMGATGRGIHLTAA